MPANSPLKEKPLVVFLRLKGEAKARMLRLCEAYSTDHNSVGMAGTLAEMRRLELSTPVSPELSALTSVCAEALKLGLTPDQVRAHLGQLVDQSLATFQ